MATHRRGLRPSQWPVRDLLSEQRSRMGGLRDPRAVRGRGRAARVRGGRDGRVRGDDACTGGPGVVDPACPGRWRSPGADRSRRAGAAGSRPGRFALRRPPRPPGAGPVPRAWRVPTTAARRPVRYRARARGRRRSPSVRRSPTGWRPSWQPVDGRDGRGPPGGAAAAGADVAAVRDPTRRVRCGRATGRRTGRRSRTTGGADGERRRRDRADERPTPTGTPRTANDPTATGTTGTDRGRPGPTTPTRRRDGDGRTTRPRRRRGRRPDDDSGDERTTTATTTADDDSGDGRDDQDDDSDVTGRAADDAPTTPSGDTTRGPPTSGRPRRGSRRSRPCDATAGEAVPRWRRPRGVATSARRPRSHERRIDSDALLAALADL